VAIFGTVLLLAVPINALWSLLRGYERQDLVYLNYAVSSVALLAAVIIGSRFGITLDGVLLIYVGAFALRLVLTIATVETRVERFRWSFDRGAVRVVLVAAQAAAVAYILQDVYSHVDVVLLGFLVHAADVGSYSAAYRLVDAVTFLTAGALTAAVFPVFSRLAVEAPERVPRLYERIVRLLVVGLVLGSLALVAFASQLVHIVYGFGDRTAHLLALLAPSTLLIPLNFTTTYLALATGRARAAILSTGIAALVNVIANLVAVPLAGVEAAAGATLLAEVTMVVVFQLALRRAGFESQALRTAVVGGGIAALPLALALTLPHRSLIAAAGAMGAVPLLVLGGVVRRDDLTAIRSAAVSRPAHV
jgi:O-antigen/teichoic acid export membrane protein